MMSISIQDALLAPRAPAQGRVSPQAAYVVLGRMLPWAAGGSLAFLAIGINLIANLPPEQLSGGVGMITLLQVPVAWLGTLLCLSMAFWAAVGLALERPLALMLAQATAPTGGMFAFLALVSGGLVSKALGGTWWSGGDREWAELFQLFWFLVVLAIPFLTRQVARADRIAGVVSVAGLFNVGIVFFGGLWMVRSPETAALLRRTEAMGDAPALLALACIAAGLWFYATVVVLMRFRCVILQRYARVPSGDCGIQVFRGARE